MSYVLRFCPLLLTFLVFSGCKEVKDPEFKRIEAFRVKTFGFQQSEIGFNVVYYNPNDFGVSVKEAAAEVFVDSVSLGVFKQDTTVAVRKNAEFSIPLSGSISFEQARKLNIESLPFREVQVRADGEVKVGKGGIFVKRPFNYTGRHRLSLKL